MAAEGANEPGTGEGGQGAVTAQPSSPDNPVGDRAAALPIEDAVSPVGSADDGGKGAAAFDDEDDASLSDEAASESEGGVDGVWDGGDGKKEEEDEHHVLAFDVPKHPKPGGMAVLARRNLDNDKAYACQPDVALMREERDEANLRIEEALVLEVLRRNP